MTLSRLMYPRNPQHLIRHFKEAISKPYGYLLIDLEPTTPDCLRLRANVLKKTIKENHLPYEAHLHIDSHSDQTCQQELHQQSLIQKDIEMHSCDNCGLLFENIHDLQRHIHRWCPENDHDFLRKLEESPNRK